MSPISGNLSSSREMPKCTTQKWFQEKYKKEDSYLDKLSCQSNKGKYSLTKKVHITYARNFRMEPTNSKI